jgi:hypothetical protein
VHKPSEQVAVNALTQEVVPRVQHRPQKRLTGYTGCRKKTNRSYRLSKKDKPVIPVVEKRQTGYTGCRKKTNRLYRLSKKDKPVKPVKKPVVLLGRDC